jgi:hypothetical protein
MHAAACRPEEHPDLDAPDLALVQVEVSTLDVGDAAEAARIVERAQSMAPLGGIFHLAMVLRDKWLPDQVWGISSACCCLHTIAGQLWGRHAQQ